MSYVMIQLEAYARSSSPLNFLKHNDANGGTLAFKNMGQDSEVNFQLGNALACVGQERCLPTGAVLVLPIDGNRNN